MNVTSADRSAAANNGRPDFDTIVRNFAPSWFAAVMGTGVVAVNSANFGQTFPVLKSLGEILHWFNVVLFFVLLVPWLLRWAWYRSQALAALRDPIMSQFYATIAIALLVLGLQFLVYGQSVEVAATFWGIGVVLTILFSFLAPWVLFTSDQVTLDHVSPGMFIPPVGLVVIPLAGNLLIPHAEGVLKEWLLFLNYTSLGAGTFLWLGLLALTVHRFIVGRPLPGAMLPTVWINLGPIGVIVVSLIGLVGASPFVSVKEPFQVAALLLWGFGVWWLIMALLLTLAYKRRGELPFSLTWWAFTFPLGAFTAASYRLSTVFHLDSLWGLGLATYGLLLFLWSAALINSVMGVVSGKLFMPPAQMARSGVSNGPKAG
jgi:C4-dicarboxylate transporter/malic acid transport protein